LVHEIPAGGYWKYELSIDSATKRTIYIPNTGYQIVLWDPGIVQKYVEVDIRQNIPPNYNEDYLRFTQLLRACEKKYDGTLALEASIKTGLGGIINLMNINFSPYTWVSEISKIDSIFNFIKKKGYFEHIFIDTVPHSNAVILNNKPYTCICTPQS
jgi:hypothetical protein